MALSIKPVSGHAIKGPLRGQRARSFVLTPDASKPAAGYTVLASALGFSFLDYGVVGSPADTGLNAKFVIGTAGTDATLNYFVGTLGTATSAISGVGQPLGASNTSVTTNPVAVYVIGR